MIDRATVLRRAALFCGVGCGVLLIMTVNAQQMRPRRTRSPALTQRTLSSLQPASEVPYWDFEQVLVELVISADRILLSNGYQVRLIGIEAPDNSRPGLMQRESARLDIPAEVLAALATEARNFSRSLVQGRHVSIEFDRIKQDDYGVLLGYVFFESPDDAGRAARTRTRLMLNEQILRQGYSRLVDTTPNRAYAALFQEAYRDVSHRIEGLWRRWCENIPVSPSAE